VICLIPEGLQVVGQPGDGSCLYRTIAYIICNQVDSDHIIFSGVSVTQIKDLGQATANSVRFMIGNYVHQCESSDNDFYNQIFVRSHSVWREDYPEEEELDGVVYVDQPHNFGVASVANKILLPHSWGGQVVVLAAERFFK